MALCVDLFATVLADDLLLPKSQNRENGYNFIENWFNTKELFLAF